jgi:hypothetical protein
MVVEFTTTCAISSSVSLEEGGQISFALGHKIFLGGPPHIPCIAKGGGNYAKIEERLYF